MSRFRHPIRASREPFGKAGLTVAILALVMATVGGAYAAGGLTKPQERQVKKIAKKFAGKPGATGPAGSAGAQGPAGSAGAAGKNGTNGANGTNGTNGKSVVTGIENAGANCEAGGVWVEVEGSGTKKYVCNGKDGASGGGTQTGQWSTSGNNEASTFATVSYAVRLEDGPTFNWVGPGGPSTAACPGTVEDPKAASDNLCFYAKEIVGLGNPGAFTANTPDPTSGATVEFPLASPEEGYAFGSWAVTD